MANDKSEAQAKQTTVEEGTEFRGTLNSRCPVVVRGMVDGDLSAPSVTVSATGTVVGNVKAKQIRSEGVLAGHVDADDVYLSGSVRSDTVIRARTLEVKLERKDKLEVTFGACVLEVGDDPAVEAQEAPAAKAQPRETPPAEALATTEHANGHGPADEPVAKAQRRSVPPPS